MSHNTFGHLFRVTTWGESHGAAIGCVVDGCPPRIPLSEADIQGYLDKRRPGQSRYTTQRQEPDQVKILSGVFTDEATGEQVTTGTPISLMIENVDQRSKDYSEIKERYRPGHADYAYDAEIRHPRLSRRRPLLGARDGDARGGGRHRAQGGAGPLGARRAGAHRRASRSTAPTGTGTRSTTIPSSRLTRNAAEAWASYLDEVRKAGSSVGAVIEVHADGVPPGSARRSTASSTRTSPRPSCRSTR